MLAHYEQPRLAGRCLAQHQEAPVVRRHRVERDRGAKVKGVSEKRALCSPTENVGAVFTWADHEVAVVVPEEEFLAAVRPERRAATSGGHLPARGRDAGNGRTYTSNVPDSSDE